MGGVAAGVIVAMMEYVARKAGEEAILNWAGARVLKFAGFLGQKGWKLVTDANGNFGFFHKAEKRIARPDEVRDLVRKFEADTCPPGQSVAPQTGTVWDRIRPTQEVWPGTEIPRSFELTTQNGQRVRVHGNATEHLAERVVGANGPRMRLELGRVVQQSQLTSLEAAVNEATRGGVRFDEIIRVGGWELRFARPRNPGDLPALIHALPLE